MKEYIVTKEILNIRSAPSDRSADTFAGQLLKGERVWLDDEEIVGVVPKGGESNVWKIKSGSRNVVAKDGVKLWQETEIFDYAKITANLNFDWISSSGNGVSIALIDTGITADNQYFKCFTQEIISGANTKLDHGNFIGGIIAGQKIIRGLAGNCKLFSIKYKSNGDPLSTVLENFIKALTIISGINEPLIINISQGFNLQLLNEKFAEKREEIATLIRQISSQDNKLIFSAADDNSAINDVLFPANMDECISVGCIDEFSKELTIEVKLDILMPMTTFTSFDNAFNPIQDAGSSYSTAIVSSLGACYMASEGQISKKIFLDELAKFSVDKSSFIYGKNNSFQYQIIQK